MFLGGGIFVIQLTSDGGSLQGLIYSTFTFICVYNLATFCSNKTDNFYKYLYIKKYVDVSSVLSTCG